MGGGEGGARRARETRKPESLAPELQSHWTEMARDGCLGFLRVVAYRGEWACGRPLRGH